MSTENTNLYFKNRGVSPNFYDHYDLPAYLKNILPASKNAKILDIGCGFGQSLLAVKKNGFENIFGIDVLAEAIAVCQDKGLPVRLIERIENYKPMEKFDFIIMSHVLEHIKKEEIIGVLEYINNNLLDENGSFFIAVPNAQAAVGCYWAYEDFTHQTMFTGGSLNYVLRSAGFDKISFLDKDCLTGRAWYKRIIVKVLQSLYLLNLRFWRKVMFNPYHKPSPMIFSWEIKALAKKKILGFK